MSPSQKAQIQARLDKLTKQREEVRNTPIPPVTAEMEAARNKLGEMMAEEWQLTKAPEVLTPKLTTKVKLAEPVNIEPSKPNRNAYMREYMRKRRAEAKGKK